MRTVPETEPADCLMRGELYSVTVSVWMRNLKLVKFLEFSISCSTGLVEGYARPVDHVGKAFID